MKTSYAQIADNLAGSIREDWVRKIRAADELLEALTATFEIIEGEYPADDEIAAPVLAKCRAAITNAS